MDKGTDLPSDFNNKVYSMIEDSGRDIRYNPKILWIGEETANVQESDKETEIAVEELQQMTDPLEFIRLTADRYPSLDLSKLSSAFKEIEDELLVMQEEESVKTKRTRKAE